MLVHYHHKTVSHGSAPYAIKCEHDNIETGYRIFQKFCGFRSNDTLPHQLRSINILVIRSRIRITPKINRPIIVILYILILSFTSSYLEFYHSILAQLCFYWFDWYKLWILPQCVSVRHVTKHIGPQTKGRYFADDITKLFFTFGPVARGVRM